MNNLLEEAEIWNELFRYFPSGKLRNLAMEKWGQMTREERDALMVKWFLTREHRMYGEFRLIDLVNLFGIPEESASGPA